MVLLRVRQMYDLFRIRWILVFILWLFAVSANAGKSDTKRVNVGDEFTVYTTSHYYLQAVLWDWDTGCLELVGSLYGTSTSATFRVKKATPLSGVIIQAVTYYYRSATTSSGINKDVDVWRVYAQDNTSVSLNYHSYTMLPGESISLKATPSNSSYSGSYSWESSYYNVASISGYDNYVSVYAKNSGNTTITVKLDNGSYDQCYITVKNITPDYVSLPSTANAYVGESTTIAPTLYPSNAQTTYSWYSRDPSIATVSNGVVTGRDEGTARIYCITANGLQSNDCYVNVKYRVPTGIKLSSSTLYVPIGQNKTLTYSVTPSNARYTVEWKSDDESVAMVSQSGVVTAKKNGTANITVRTDNGYSAKCTVTVPPDPSSISLYSKAMMIYGETRTLKYTLLPVDAYKSLTWTSSNPDIVSVSSDGTLTARHDGKAVVTVTTSNGKSASCEVEVLNPDYRLYVWLKNGEKMAYLLAERPVAEYRSDGNFYLRTKQFSTTIPAADIRKFTLRSEAKTPLPTEITMTESLSLGYHETYKLEYDLLPLDYDIKTSLVWLTTDVRVAEVNQEGLVRALSGGEADIVLTADNGCEARCHVSVPVPDFQLVVWLKDGTRDTYHFAEKPVVVYENNAFNVKSGTSQTSYPCESVRKFTLVNLGAVCGDANCDGVVDVADITSVAAFILGNSPSPFNENAADANADGSIDVSDITTIANKILNN